MGIVCKSPLSVYLPLWDARLECRRFSADMTGLALARICSDGSGACGGARETWQVPAAVVSSTRRPRSLSGHAAASHCVIQTELMMERVRAPPWEGFVARAAKATPSWIPKLHRTAQ